MVRIGRMATSLVVLPSTIALAGHDTGADRPRPCDRLVSDGPQLPFATGAQRRRLIPKWATAELAHAYRGSAVSPARSPTRLDLGDQVSPEAQRDLGYVLLVSQQAVGRLG